MDQSEEAVTEQPVETGTAEQQAAPEDKNSTTAKERAKSTIQFPYGDLDVAVAAAKKIFAGKGQQQADMAQIVALLGHDTSDSGAFRFKLSTARTFGLIDADSKQGRLTEIGIRIVDPEFEALAKVQAFLAVPLFKVMYERYKNRILPLDKVIEGEMIALGVAPKQGERARQVFQKSAELAGLFTYGKGKLILPGGVSEAMLGSDTGQNGHRQLTAPPIVEPHQASAADNGCIRMMIKTLPPPGSVVTEEAREIYVRAFNAALDEIYQKSTR
jgi:hypothetical protein